MKLVTYEAGEGPRVGRLDDDGVVDVGFDGDMVAFIEAGAPVSSTTAVEGARLLAPLRRWRRAAPRSQTQQTVSD